MPVRVLIPLFFYYLEKCMTTYCSDCDNKIDAQDIKYPVGDGYICDDCFSPDEYDKCVYCGDHTYYKYSQLNSLTPAVNSVQLNLGDFSYAA